MPGRLLKPTLDVAGALCLTASVTMLADFTHRLLNSDPDELGLAAIVVQAAFAVAASSAFTRAGWGWLGEILQGFGRVLTNRSAWRFGLSSAFFVLMVPVWYFLPLGLATYYNNRGYNERSLEPDNALRDYQRAIALNPNLHEAYVNLGGLMESFYRYSDAAEQYRRGITVDHSDPTPYSNLARMLLLNGDSLNALRITEDGLRIGPHKQVRSALLKNKAWAEFNLGFNQQAIADATQSNTAAGECLLGKIYGKMGKPAEAQQAWKSFRQRVSNLADTEPIIEPDCALLAEETQ